MDPRDKPGDDVGKWEKSRLEWDKSHIYVDLRPPNRFIPPAF